MRAINRRFLCGVGAGLLALPALAAEPPADITRAQDFDELWETLRDRYCFFAEKATDWERARRTYRPMAAGATSPEAFVEAIRLTLNELYDAHTHLTDPPEGSPRWPPYDLVVAPAGDAALVRDVLEGSVAAVAGLAPGDHVLSVDGRPVAAIAAAHVPRCLARPDPEALAYAWNVAVAGRRRRPRTVVVKPRRGARRTVELGAPPGAGEPDLSWRRLDGGLGYVRIASFGDPATIARFDEALEALKGAPGLILDVRRNGGGDTAVARPIMGRFIAERRPYARMRRREGPGLGPAWTEYVDPRGPFTYLGPVVVLTDAWSASMAEGFPMGMRGLGRARIVGTRMMGLGAAVFQIRLDRTGLQAQYSAEPVYDVGDRPRWELRPDVETRPGEDILAAGVRELRRMAGA